MWAWCGCGVGVVCARIQGGGREGEGRRETIITMDCRTTTEHQMREKQTIHNIPGRSSPSTRVCWTHPLQCSWTPLSHSCGCHPAPVMTNTQTQALYNHTHTDYKLPAASWVKGWKVMPQGADTRLFLVVHTPSVRLLTGMSLLSFVDSQAAKNTQRNRLFLPFLDVW